MIKHIAYNSGIIRDKDGKLVGFYEASTKQLYVDGHLKKFDAEDMEAAMEIIGKLVK